MLTTKEAIAMLQAKVECITRETSGLDYDCNNARCDLCHFNYAQGTMGEQKEYLKMAINALEKQKNFEKVYRTLIDTIDIVCRALVDITNKECSDYGYTEACNIADSYLEGRLINDDQRTLPGD